MSQSDTQAMLALHLRFANARAYLMQTKLRDVDFPKIIDELKACEEERHALSKM